MDAERLRATADEPQRLVPFDLVRSEGETDGLTLEGYAAVFGDWAEINNWEGNFLERIMPGAFKKTLAERANQIVLQFDHGTHPLIGSIPIGSIRELREDSRGLFVRAHLHDNWLIEPVRDAIRERSINGMSFRFGVPSGKDKWEFPPEGLPRRSVHETILRELGPVVWPAYDRTEVSVRSLNIAQNLYDADEDTRVEVARLLILGTRPEAAKGTSERAATDDGTPPDGAATDQEERSDAEEPESKPAVEEVSEPPREGHSSHPTRFPLSRDRRERTLAFARELRDLSHKRFDQYERRVRALEANKEEV